jgi:predicted metallo-beta-lactamase superfamily hydrolase
MAVAAATGRIGCVLLVGSNVEQCKMLRRSGLKSGIATQYARGWIRDMEPEALVTEDVGFSSRKSKTTIRNIHAIIAEGRKADLVIYPVLRTKKFKNKFDEALALAKRHPEMTEYLPKRNRKCFDTEHRKLILFEALSMAHAAYGWDNKPN